jgi:hypothetical protein
MRRNTGRCQQVFDEAAAAADWREPWHPAQSTGFFGLTRIYRLASFSG